ncbi:ABC transporter ATP-binding protein [Paenibacillus sp. UMB4589-SE434]|uniref:ABC transporter ATP-binding protein n=1 Tax=Paenibacillus sp. UMB4589-SE434 TaxID=3046314 RepID=UPI00254B361F|nr:ABC transporter ATP-binding protein [Paenibacillus sp. UMB4589-SE434]MDK8181439.1 ABC transporter ATP-binding protein [Paenibacillus sp. UMB4589-SE434]
MMRLFRYLKPYRLPIGIILALVFVQSLSELYLPTLMSDIVNFGISKGDVPYIWQIGGIMLAVAIGGTICAIISSYMSAKVAMGYGKLMRGKVFNHVQHFSLQEFDQIGTASLITRTTNDITQVQQVLVMILRMMVSAPMMCIGGIIMAVNKDAKLTLVLAVVIPILALAIFAVASKGIPLFKAMQKKLDKLNLVLREGLIGIRVIRSFNRTTHEKQRFNDANTDLTQTAIKVNRIMASLMPIMMLAFNFSTIAIIWFGSDRINAGSMQVGDLMAFIQYATQIMFSLVMVSIIFVMIPRASASATRINEVLEMEPVIRDQANGKQASGQHGYIEFDRVTFSYPGAENPALSDISFSARPGETTAIIGGTGSGKSTMLNLIPRFYDIDSGRILVNGIDVREFSHEDLRAKIGLVPQKAVLFSGTIADNIRYGKRDATDEEMRHAADVAQATEFINGMPDGFESTIAQGGTNVSGGQKQRLSIARALVRKPEIYIFDDSFSALDFKTDAKLRAALKGETVDSTVILVAQRVSTVMDADRIIVLEEGRIADVGTHKELLEKSDVYREIVSSQFSEEEIA